MRYLKLMLLTTLFLSVGLASAADKTVKITKVAGTVQLMKNGVVIMTIKPGDKIPAKLDAGVTFFVVNGTMEVEAGGMKIVGVTGSEFKPTFSGGAMTVVSGGRASVVIKNSVGQSIVMTSNSAVKLDTTSDTTEVVVQKGRAVVSNPSGGGTQVVNAGETTSFAAAPPIVTQTQQAAPTEEPQPQEELVAQEAVVPVQEPTSVIETQEASETEIVEAIEVSGSTP